MFTRRPRVREKAIQAQVQALLAAVGAEVWTLGTVRAHGDHPGTRQTPGLPDLLAFLPLVGAHRGARALVCIEVKAEGGRLRPGQRAFQEACQAADVSHLVGGYDVVLADLVRRGLIKPDRVPHYRVTP